MKAIIPFLLLALTATANAQVSMGINRVVYVAASRDAEVNCAGLRSVLDSIEGPLAFYRVILEPGFYTCGVDTLVVPDWTVLEGSGLNSTIIFGNSGAPTGVITLGDASDLRNLTVRNTGGGTLAVSISTGLTTQNAFNDIIGVYAESEPASSSSIALNVGPNTGHVAVRDSVIRGKDEGAIINTTGFVLFLTSSVSGVVVIAGNPVCRHSWNGAFAFDLNLDCSTSAARSEGQEAPLRRPPMHPITSYPEREKQ